MKGIFLCKKGPNARIVCCKNLFYRHEEKKEEIFSLFLMNARLISHYFLFSKVINDLLQQEGVVAVIEMPLRHHRRCINLFVN